MTHPELAFSGSLEFRLSPPAGGAPVPGPGSPDRLFAFEGLALLFAATPTEITRVKAKIGSLEIPANRAADGNWRLRWGRRDESTLALQVEFSGSEPLLTDAYWCRRQVPSSVNASVAERGPQSERIPEEEQLSQLQIVPRGERGEDPRLGVANSTDEDRDSLLFRHADWIVESLEDVAALAVDQLADLRRGALHQSLSCRLFFLELDELRGEGARTCLAPAESKAFRLAIGSVQYSLQTRLQVRAELYRRDLQPNFSKLNPEGLDAISAGFRRLFETHLVQSESTGTPQGPPDLWGAAFEQFAIDRGGAFHSDPRCSALLIRQGVPDGEFFLCFGELALLCIDEEVDEEFWRARLPELVRATHMFVEHRAPRGWFSRETEPLVDIDGQPRSAFGFREGLGYPRRRRAELHNDYAEIARRLPNPEARLRVLRTRFSRLVGECLRCFQAFGRGPFTTEEQLAHYDPQPIDGGGQERSEGSATA